MGPNSQFPVNNGKGSSYDIGTGPLLVRKLE